MGSEYSIPGFYQKVKLLCGNEKHDPVELVPFEINGKLYRKCPICDFVIPESFCEKYYEKLMKIMGEDSINNTETNLTNYTVTQVVKSTGRKYSYKVIKHTVYAIKATIFEG